VTASLILEGSRAVAAVCRPYPISTVGTPERIDFDIASTSFRLKVRVRADDIPRTAEGEELVTEIYVPFVHYAASLAPYGTSDDFDSTKRNASNVSLLRESATPSPSNGKPSTIPLQLSIDVRVSAGTCTIRGQTLRWSYPIPSTGAATYEIEIKRRDGALRRELGWVGGLSELRHRLSLLMREG